MLTKLTIENFKAHAHTELTLEPFTVLVGANGVGKSSVLHALQTLVDTRRVSIGEIFDGMDSLGRVVRSRNATLELRGDFLDSGGHTATAVARMTPPPASLGASGSRTGLWPGGAFAPFDSWPKGVNLWSTTVLRPRAQAVAATGYHEVDELGLDGSGLNTAAVLGSWKLDDAETWRIQRVVAALRSVVPQVRNIRVRSAPLMQGRGNGYDLFFDFDDAKGVPASSVSEGTLVALAILTALYTDPQPQLLLLDDLGAELHPTGQGELVRVLLAIQAEHPELQIVASTHSPFILDALEPKNVRVFARGQDGAARVRSLAEHPQAGHEGITTGQLWTLDPESWVLEGQP